MLTRTKPQKELGTRRCMKKPPKGKHSELKEPHETLDKTKTLTIIAREKKAKEKAPDEAFYLERSPTETTLRRTEPIKC